MFLLCLRKHLRRNLKHLYGKKSKPSFSHVFLSTIVTRVAFAFLGNNLFFIRLLIDCKKDPANLTNLEGKFIEGTPSTKCNRYYKVRQKVIAKCSTVGSFFMEGG